MKKILIAFLILLLISCSSHLSEEEQYEKLQNSIVFKTYTKASILSTKPAVQQVNDNLKREQVEAITKYQLQRDFTENDAHTAMALLWVLSMKPDFAIAKALIANENIQNEKERFRVRSILALAMHQNEWVELAAATSIDMQEVLQDDTLKEELYYEQIINYFSYGLLSLKQGDNKGARWAFTELGLLVDVAWLSETVDAILLVKEGHPKDGLKKLKALSENATLPESERQYVEKLIAALEEQADNFDSDFFVTKVFGNAVFDNIVGEDKGALSEIFNKLKQLKNNFTKLGSSL